MSSLSPLSQHRRRWSPWQEYQMTTAVARSPIDGDRDVGDVDQLEAWIVGQKKQAERAVEITADVGVEPVPFALVVRKGAALLAAHVPAKAAAGVATVVGAAAGQS